MSTWFQQHRVEWIAEAVLIFGFINREHIQKKFGVSTPQASLDINLAIQTYPGLLAYNASAKRYELAAGGNYSPGQCLREALSALEPALSDGNETRRGKSREDLHKHKPDIEPDFLAGEQSGETSPGAQEGRQCERCQGNGEIVTDWERYRHPHDGDVGDEAVAECPDCNGEGTITDHSAPQEVAAKVLHTPLTMRINEVLDEGDGFWRSCSGCHELHEGCPTGDYSATFRAHLGVGCRECGGLGVVWDDTDYAAMGDYLASSAGPAPISVLPQDVVDLVIAARIVAYEDQSPEALRGLDVAASAFAERVPWDDDPEALKAEAGAAS